MKLFILLLFFTISNSLLYAQSANSADSVMITIFLKHQQDKSLKKIQEVQEENKLWDMFPPKEARVISWYVMMGIGQVVTLKIEGKDLRKVNLAIENGAWGAFNTEFYPTYDFVPIWKEGAEKRKGIK